MEGIIKINEFVLIQTSEHLIKEFNNAIEKEMFIKSRDFRGYELHRNYAKIKLYMVIDTEANGWCLTPNGAVNLENAKLLINQYL